MATTLNWRVHTRSLFEEVLSNKTTGPLHQPLNIAYSLLQGVAKRASELNDPALNALMCRLTLYAIADPYSPDYDLELTNRLIENGK